MEILALFALYETTAIAMLLCVDFYYVNVVKGFPDIRFYRESRDAINHPVPLLGNGKRELSPKVVNILRRYRVFLITPLYLSAIRRPNNVQKLTVPLLQ